MPPLWWNRPSEIVINLKLTLGEAAAIGGALNTILDHFAPDDLDIQTALEKLEAALFLDEDLDTIIIVPVMGDN